MPNDTTPETLSEAIERAQSYPPGSWPRVLLESHNELRQQLNVAETALKTTQTNAALERIDTRRLPLAEKDRDDYRRRFQAMRAEVRRLNKAVEFYAMLYRDGLHRLKVEQDWKVEQESKAAPPREPTADEIIGRAYLISARERRDPRPSLWERIFGKPSRCNMPLNPGENDPTTPKPKATPVGQGLPPPTRPPPPCPPRNKESPDAPHQAHS